jgi:hypothetical protein
VAYIYELFVRVLVFENLYNDDDDDVEDDNSIQFFVYLRAELNSRWPITESAQNIIKN